MACALDNQTPLPAKLQSQPMADGRPGVLLVAKATWRLDNGRLAAAEQQQGLRLLPLRMALGDLELDDAQRKGIEHRADEEIIWLDHDMSAPKPLFDVLLAGYATRRSKAEDKGKPPPWFEAGIVLGGRTVVLRAHPPRYWERGWLGQRATALATHAERIPVSYAFADGEGGFALDAPEDQKQWLPWIESPKHPSTHRRYADEVAGFGYWPESAAHRRRHMGTYDDAWQQHRAPALPKDFDARFFNVAHPTLQLAREPAAGDTLKLICLSEQPVIDVRYPALSLAIAATTASGATLAPQTLRADTLTLEPDQNRMSLTYRLLLPAVGSDAPRSVRLFRRGGQT